MDLATALLAVPTQTMVIAVGLSLLLLSILAALRVNATQTKQLQQHQQDFQAQQQEYQQQLQQLREQNLVLTTRAEASSEQLDQRQSQLYERESQLASLQRLHSEQTAQLASVSTELAQHRLATGDKIQLLEQARSQLSRDFELLSNRIFDEKTASFNQHNKASLDNVLNPLREQLKDFRQKVEDVYDKDSKERVSLLAELGHLKQLNQQISSDAVNLTNALKGDNKIQGNWGEVILERVLEESGLHKGREYDTQVNLKSDQGRRRSPDVIIRLPENKDIIIDAKVSLLAYENYCNSNDELQRKQALKAHSDSIRSHINGLSVKDYEQLQGIRSLDFVFIFIPIESAFMAAFEYNQKVFNDAYEKNIIVVGPTTLLASLRTVQSIWRYERQNKNAEEIARQAGAMHDKFVGFIDDLDKISDHLIKAVQVQESAMNKLSSGKGNLIGSAQRLQKLGAKVKKQLSHPHSADDEEEGIKLPVLAHSVSKLKD
jgi:DNA recombination protein RmuC